MTGNYADISWIKRKYLDVVYAGESSNQRMDIYLPGAVVEFTTFPTADHDDEQFGSEENMELLWQFIHKYL